jgi:Uma2 family endonuclease
MAARKRATYADLEALPKYVVGEILFGVLHAPELHLGAEPDVVVPDLAGWTRERLSSIPAKAFLTLAPDWVAEIVSASTEAVDRGEKMTIYAREKVAHAWMLDPIIRTLEVFRLDGETWRMLKTWHGDVKVRAEPFDAIELELGSLWK